ncbi:MAG: Hsp20/alpha crystallin family protein [Lachnospiraceae bacterium]|nr:Hsp20/alpha crystallin family protein [Lachnospiraceae bacterium]
MYVPSIFGESLMDDWMEDFDRSMREMDREFDRGFGKRNPLFGKHAKNLMKTDVREKEDSYEVDIELPGFKKEEIELKLENGFLSITAAKGLDKEEKDKKDGKILRQERYAGSLSRSFYVGEELKEEDVKAKLEHGVLKLTLPKKEKKAQVPEKKQILIEG